MNELSQVTNPNQNPPTGVTWWTQAWRTLWRDARAGELRLLVVAVALGVAALSSVSFLADRLNGGLQRDARQLLGGDVVVVSDQVTPAHIVQRAKDAGLQGVSTLSFPTMARGASHNGADSNSRLVALKAVEAGYPLRGELQVASSLAQAEVAAKTTAIPASGEVWVEAAGLEALGLDVGDSVLLGNSRLRISRVLVHEPDRGAGFMNFAPRVLMNSVDLAATALIQPASRVTWRYAVVGPDAAAKNFLAWVDAESKKPEVRGVRVESLEAGRPEMRQTLDRAAKFLNLVALLAALLSAVAVALAARTFATRHLDDCAMLRVLGLSQRHIALSYTAEFVWVGTFASVLGLALGYAVHVVFVALLKGLVETELPAPSVWPFVYGLSAGLTLLLAFGLPPVLQLASVPALRVMRRDVGELKATTLSVWALGLTGFAVLLIAVSRDLKLGLMVVARLCRRGVVVCGHGLVGRTSAAPQRGRGQCTALVDAGHASGECSPRLCDGAGEFIGCGLVGLGVVGVATHRPHQQLAQCHAGGCAQSVCHQYSTHAS